MRFFLAFQGLFAWSYLNDLLEQMSPASLRREEFPHVLPEQWPRSTGSRPPVSPILRAETLSPQADKRLARDWVRTLLAPAARR